MSLYDYWLEKRAFEKNSSTVLRDFVSSLQKANPLRRKKSISGGMWLPKHRLNFRSGVASNDGVSSYPKAGILVSGRDTTDEAISMALRKARPETQERFKSIVKNVHNKNRRGNLKYDPDHHSSITLRSSGNMRLPKRYVDKTKLPSGQEDLFPNDLNDRILFLKEKGRKK